jgi:MoaA/NifB/PqqE/SkfB family radical SAM enzyme
MSNTVAFSKKAANVFFHVLTQCNLTCRHCYINPIQHGTRRLSRSQIELWLAILARTSPHANLVLLGGEPTLHPDLAFAVKSARNLGYASVTIDTNGYLFNDILERVLPGEVDFFSFSLDGATAGTNDHIRGKGSFEACTAGIAAAKAKGFQISLIYTVSGLNLHELDRMPPLLSDLGVDRFFIQVIGLRGQSAAAGSGGLSNPQVSRDDWRTRVPPVAEAAARLGIRVTYPKVYLELDETFECAGKVADNYFIFPNGRVYRCPLCEDYPIHSLVFDNDRLTVTPRINEADLFELEIPEGCVMNRLIQPQNIIYAGDGRPAHKIACCLLKEEVLPQ